MTEAAIKRAKKQKIKKIFVITGIVFLVALVALWYLNFNALNDHAIKQETKYYETDEFVEFEKDFFYNSTENNEGYAIRVNSAELINYKEFMESHGVEIKEENYTPDFPMPKYLVLLNVTFKNENSEGMGIDLRWLTLTRGSMSMSIDFEALALADDFFDGFTGFKIMPNTEADINIVYSPESLGHSQGLAFDEVNKALEEDDFYLTASLWPTRKLIRVTLDK